MKAAGAEGWGWALASFAGIFTILFTTFLTHPGGLWDGVYTGLKYWLDQHGVARGGEPWQFYSTVLVTIEWPALLLGRDRRGLAVQAQRRCSPRFLVWDFLLSLAVYSWAGEKFAWLVLHPLLPLVLLAGTGVQAIWQARGAWRVAGFARRDAAAWSTSRSRAGGSTWTAAPTRASSSSPPSPRPRSATSPTRSRRSADSRGPGKPPLTVTVDAAEGATFPYAWYFRHLSAGYIDYQQANSAPPTSDVLTLTDASKTRLAGALNDYDCRPFKFRVWWVRDYGILKAADDKSPGPMRPGALWRYITQRKTWTPTGGMNESLCIKKGV